MSDPYLHSDPAYLRAIAARDPLAAYLYVRSLRSAYVRAKMSALFRFIWRHIRPRSGAALQSASGGEPFENPLSRQSASAPREGRG